MSTSLDWAPVPRSQLGASDAGAPPLRSRDPTGTGKQRRKFRATALLHLNRLRAQMRIAIIEHDLLGLAEGQMAFHPVETRMYAWQSWLITHAAQAVQGLWYRAHLESAWASGSAAAARELTSLSRAAADSWEEGKHPRGYHGHFATTEQETEAIKRFIGDDPYANAISIGGALRAREKLTEAQQLTVAGVDSAIAKSVPLDRDTTFYRGTDVDVYPGSGERDPAFTSVSTNRAVAEEFATATSEDDGGVVYEIVVPKGVRALNVGPYQGASMAYQSEFILPRNAMFERVGKSYRRDGILNQKLRYVTLEARDSISPMAFLEQLVRHDLDGIMAATLQQTARIAAAVVVRRVRPAVAWRMISTVYDKIAAGRMELLVDHYTVRAHNDAKLAAYRAAGIVRLGINPELRAGARVIQHDAKDPLGHGSEARGGWNRALEKERSRNREYSPAVINLSNRRVYTALIHEQAKAKLPTEAQVNENFEFGYQLHRPIGGHMRGAFVTMEEFERLARAGKIKFEQYDAKDPLGHGSEKKRPDPHKRIREFSSISEPISEKEREWNRILERQRELEGFKPAARDPKTGKVHAAGLHATAARLAGLPSDIGMKGVPSENIGYLLGSGEFISRKEAEHRFGRGGRSALLQERERGLTELYKQRVSLVRQFHTKDAKDPLGHGSEGRGERRRRKGRARKAHHVLAHHSLMERLLLQNKQNRQNIVDADDIDVGVRTAGDFKVCQECEDYAEGAPYELSEVEGMLPLHPRCRCSWYPWHDRRFKHDAKDPLGHGSEAHGGVYRPVGIKPRSSVVVNVNNRQVEVLTNPSLRTLEQVLMEPGPEGPRALRLIRDPEGNVYAWAGDWAVHEQIKKALGITTPNTKLQKDQWYLWKGRWESLRGRRTLSGRQTNEANHKASMVVIKEWMRPLKHLALDAYKPPHVAAGSHEGGQFGTTGKTAKKAKKSKTKKPAASKATAKALSKSVSTKNTEGDPISLNAEAVDVGGDDWNQHIAKRLEGDYQRVKPELDKLAKSVVGVTGWAALSPKAQDMTPSVYAHEMGKTEADFMALSNSAKMEWIQSNQLAKVALGTEGSGKIEEPEHYDPLATETEPKAGGETRLVSSESYKRTQQVANAMATQRFADLLKERGVKTTVTAASISKQLWGEWKDSSTSLGGMAIQMAVAEELGGRLRKNAFDEYVEFEPAATSLEPQGPETATTSGVEAVKTNADKFIPGGYAAVKAMVRAQWETCQWLLDKAGTHTVGVYRGVFIDVGKKEKTEEVKTDKLTDEERKGGARDAWFKLPGTKIDRNGASSWTTDPDVANNWAGAGEDSDEGEGEHVTLRAQIPRTAVISVPAMGLNLAGEHEVVVAGTAWKSWDAWRESAPAFDKVAVK